MTIARNMQLQATGAVDSAPGVTCEHPFHLPGVFRDGRFYPQNKSHQLGRGTHTHTENPLSAPLPSLFPFGAAKTRHDGAL